jgi:hypothetical protein
VYHANRAAALQLEQHLSQYGYQQSAGAVLEPANPDDFILQDDQLQCGTQMLLQHITMPVVRDAMAGHGMRRHPQATEHNHASSFNCKHITTAADESCSRCFCACSAGAYGVGCEAVEAPKLGLGRLSCKTAAGQLTALKSMQQQRQAYSTPTSPVSAGTLLLQQLLLV